MLNFIQKEKLDSIVRSGNVTDDHISDYLQGVEYSKWAEGKDLEATIEVVIGQDENGSDMIEVQLVNVYDPVDVTSHIVQWKLSNFAELRKAEYPPIEEYMDAMVKGDTVAMQEYSDKCLAVKAKWPKE